MFDTFKHCVTLFSKIDIFFDKINISGSYLLFLNKIIYL